MTKLHAVDQVVVLVEIAVVVGHITVRIGPE